MSKSGSIRAGRAFVELFADDSKLVRGLRRAEKKLKAFGNGIRNLGLKMVALGTAVLTPMIGAARRSARWVTRWPRWPSGRVRVTQPRHGVKAGGRTQFRWLPELTRFHGVVSCSRSNLREGKRRRGSRLGRCYRSGRGYPLNYLPARSQSRQVSIDRLCGRNG
jgi:hypothetical protein